MPSSLIELGSVELLELGAYSSHQRYAPAIKQRALQPLWQKIADLAQAHADEVMHAAGLNYASPQLSRRLQAALVGQPGLLDSATVAARAMILLTHTGRGHGPHANQFRSTVARTLRLLPDDRRQALVTAAETELLSIAKEFASEGIVAEKLHATRLAASAPGDFTPQDLTRWERLRMQGVVLGDLDAWEEYVNLSAELFFDDEEGLDGVSLGKKKKKKGFLTKIGGFLKKAVKKIVPAVMLVAGAYTGSPQLIAAGVSGLMAKDPKKVKGPAAVAAQGGVMLQNMGIELPGQVQGFVNGVNASLTPDELTAAQREVLAASGNDPAVRAALLAGSSTPTWVWVAAAGGGVVALGAVAYALTRKGSST